MTYKKKPIHKSFTHPGGFVGLPRRVFRSPEYKNLSVNARCILDELQDRYFGNNNGRICLTVEDAAEEIGRSYNTAKTAFWELEEKGFIERMLEGDYRKGKAREWRLTYEQYQGREPTDDWKNRIASSNFETAPSKNEG